ncbi:hypothetical protein DFH07DRAFT_465940 [Mycena maculata]|uniref:Protein HGH1 homolog n=1 Tax=Mycena maculata TaxID=230809 RepID=A0AAD7K864_9AGAR|nr:hypothetical protein DFH07DRAFT_465940 [Mycena maculata]
MEAQLRELIPFLRDRNPQVRQIALSNLLPQTPKDSPHRNIFLTGLKSGGLQKPKENDIIRDLKLLCRDQLSVAHDAFRALVNLSDSPMLVAPLSEPAFLAFIVSYIINPQSVLADLASMLLSNLTASSAACATVLSLNIDIILEPTFLNAFYPSQSRCATCVAPVPYPAGEPRAVPALPLLVDAFVQGAEIEESGDASTRIRKGNLHFLASVFANLTTSPAGRNFFLGPRASNTIKPDSAVEYPLAKLLAFTEHKDTIRRGGVASTMKNCVFHAPGHQAILSPDSATVSVPPASSVAPGIDALPYLLLPLAGPEEFDLEDQDKLPDALQFLPPTKVREPDAAIRLIHVETLLLLCHTRWGRDYLREHGVYEIVRAAHENESVDKISEHIERLVNLLKGDEPETDSSDGDLLDHAQALEPSVGTALSGDASDDEDSRIDEV